MNTELNQTGTGDMVFVDKGAKDGIQSGNVFVVTRRGDMLQGRGKVSPDHVVGRLLVVGVREESSTAMVLDTKRALERGDKISIR